MIVKKYIVDNLNEALVRAKYELGENALIISKSKIKVGKWYEIFKEEKWEVIVGVEEEQEPKNVLKTNMEFEKIIRNNKLLAYPSKLIKEQFLGYLTLNLIDIENVNNRDLENFIDYIYKDNCFSRKVGLKRINVFVGPTGVGKTTTIAKLAAMEHFKNEKTVGLITMDTYRIGAVEQLKTYGNILGVQFEVARNPEEVMEKIDSMSHCDVILIDTLGTSQKNGSKIDDIKEFIDEIGVEKETFLVASISTNTNILLSIMESYKKLDYNAMILTKFDEAMGMVNFWDLMNKIECPIEYFSYGQNVPEDIQVASLENLVKYGEELNGRPS